MRRQTFRLATVAAALLTAATVAAQRVEYFWDEDPGIGHGQVLQTFTGSQATIDAELDASSLPPGIHQLGLRTVHGDYYSATYHRTFYVPAPEETISRIEYSWDMEAQPGQGTPLAFSAVGNVVELSQQLSAAKLSPGLHTLYLRTLTEQHYSLTYARQFYVLPVAQEVQAVEYFFDSDPGVGKGHRMGATLTGDSLSLAFDVSTTGLSYGTHYIGLRTLTGATWSATYYRQFLVRETDAADDEVARIEYFFDNDPGRGMAQDVAFSPGQEVTVDFLADASSLTEGSHKLGLRARSGSGTWSSTVLQQGIVIKPADAPQDPIDFTKTIEVANSDGVTIYYRFINNNTELEVTYRGDSWNTYTDEYSGDVVIPASVTLNGMVYPVTNIGDYAFNSCSGLTSVAIPNSVMSIGEEVFRDCGGLTNVTIPNSVTSIGDRSFYRCSGLTSVIIPNSVTKLGNSTFSGCSGLTKVTISNSVTTIGDSDFEGCSGLTSVTIPNSVTSIGWRAFYGCSGLTSITIPNSVTSIGAGAFRYCSGLTSIKVEENNKKYDSRDNCNAIIETSTNSLIAGCKNTVIPNSITTIGKNAFEGCTGLTSVTIPNSVTSIESSAFEDCTSLTSVTIPNSVTSIESSAFADCTSLTSVTIPNSVTSIESSTFYGCTSLTSVTIPNSVTTIGSSAFYGCSGLTSVTIPNSVTAIGNYAFWGCSSLTSVTIPNSVTSIESSAFWGCSSLTSVTIPNSVTSIESSAFADCTSLTSVTIPNSVTSIESRAFYGCTSLTSVTIPNSVTSIESSAFYGCTSLTSVTIPNSITTIGKNAFRNCSGLTSVTIPNSVTSIGNDAFYRCDNLIDVFCYAKTLPSVNVYNSFSSISSSTLHVPTSALEDYRTMAPWSEFGTIVTIEDEPEDDLQDYLDSFADTEDVLTEATYTRTFNNTQWQAIYVPFMLYNSYWSANFELARLKAFHQYDDNGDGTIDRQELEAEMTTDNLVYNTPYLIRAKNVGTYTVSVKNSWREDETATTTVLSAAHGSLSVTGNYGQLTGLKSDGRYRLQGGALSVPRTDTEVLSSYRWYATLSGQAASRPLTVRFTDGTTAVIAAGGAEVPVVYDLRGRRIDTNNPSLLPKGIYIIDGKKYTVK